MRRGARGDSSKWPAPGEPRAEVARRAREIRTTWTRTTRALDDATAGEHFALVALRADRIDHLSLKKNERVVYEIVDGNWTSTRVNP